ncbi:hypothetical protein DFAR_560016 [Desulfarculales bacterium]
MIVASSKTNLLILNDWGLEKLSRKQSLDILGVLETATAEALPSSPSKCPWTRGTKSSAIPPWPMPSSIA